MKYIIMILLIASPALANQNYVNYCAGCHRVDASGIAGYSPKLAGQHWQYLRDQMRDIKLGRRTNGSSGVMQPLFKRMSDEEIKALAKYLGDLDE